LEVLLRQAGRAFTRFELMDAAIGEDAVVLERTIDVHIKSLRKKLGDAAELIETVRGVGYRFHEPRVAVESLTRHGDAGPARRFRPRPPLRGQPPAPPGPSPPGPTRPPPGAA